jgi:ribosomal protein S18 acetylase RimI-like enzyme
VETGDVLRPGAADASVRPARAGDAAAMATVQARAWRRAYADVFPPAVLEQLTPERLEPSWRQAVTDPPSARYAVLVACAGSAVVGFAATAPSTDQDADPDDGELVALEVDPAHQRAGHGSRLLAASVDSLRDHAFAAIRVWCPRQDQVRHAFLSSAGLRPDGASRSLRAPSGGAPMAQERLAAALGS